MMKKIISMTALTGVMPLNADSSTDGAVGSSARLDFMPASGGVYTLTVTYFI